MSALLPALGHKIQIQSRSGQFTERNGIFVAHTPGTGTIINRYLELSRAAYVFGIHILESVNEAEPRLPSVIFPENKCYV